MILFLLCASSCATLLGRATDLHGQLQELVAKEMRAPGSLGTLLPASRAPSNSRIAPTLNPSKPSSTDLCFETGLQPGNEQDHQKEVEVLRKWTLVPEARTSLDTAAKSPWPTPPPAGRQTIRTTTRQGDVFARICTQAPVITAETKFLTIAMLASGAEFANYVLVFDFTGQRK